ncbi:vWA domain-containing protein [Streptomyces sp. MOE7]|uniref:vWA domain-containing protein n=1 Tax=Streptomyces sp. MOE7 TaxID=1961713 RepID=UPI0009FFDE05|nr:VWA domain-containing protein [Streptomyces sp. MOE7]ARH92104.1 toxic cation resistance protein [Streptomyces sp. MOE7]
MGIRSLLRNAFGRSKATREESGAAPSGAGKPESATIPEAREESTPAAAPEAEVPAARTAPSDDRATDPAPTPAPTLPAQGSPVDRTESPVRDTADVVDVWDAADVRDEPTTEAAEKTTAEPEAEPTAETEPEAEPKAETAAEPEVEDKAAAEAEVPSTEQAAAEAAPAPTDLVSQAFDTPAPEPAPVATPAAEPVVEAVEEPVEAKTADAEPQSEPEVAAEVAADAAPEAEAEAEPTSDPQPETAPETTAETATEPEAAPETTPEPAASEPKATEAAAVADATAVTEATEDAATTSGTSLPTAAPALLGLYKAAGATLEKHGLTSQRAAVYLVLDRSGSMRNYYKDGTVQNLAEQALGLAAHFDEDPTVPVVFFSTDVDGTADIDLTNYEGRIEELHAGLGHMGRTNYHWAVNAVVDHYKKSGSTAPAFVLFQTDGAPTSKPAAERALCEAAELPIFWQFIGFGDPEAKGFDFLRKLDDLTVPEKRRVDNAGFFHAGREPRSLSHEELYQQLMVEFPEWLTEARTAGVLKDN